MKVLENGRQFEVIKYRPTGIEQYLKYDAIYQVGDIMKECDDGWFLNVRTRGRTNILAIENYQEYFKEI